MGVSRTMAGLHHLDSGAAGSTGPALVLVHGAGGSHLHWPPALRQLPGRRVIAVDLPGHGTSPGPAPATVEGFARALVGLLEALHLEEVVVVGHSMGGAVALTLALEEPARVAGLVLVGSGAKLRVAPALLEATLDPALAAEAAELVAQWSFGSLAGSAQRALLLETFAACGPGVAHGDFAACDAFDARARLGELRVPTLVLTGAEDRLTPPRFAQFLGEHLAGARVALVPEAGHLVMLEAPAVVAREVEAFLGALPPPA
jgi:pimeloyl-ACP methyl ester carboxylesterase